jgi:hypothetical protein
LRPGTEQEQDLTPGELPADGARDPGAAGPRLVVIEAPDLAALPPACRLRLMPAPRRLSHLSAQWLAENRVQGVVFALFATVPDAWQIGSQLTRAGFGGRLFALSPALPNRRMVERELRADYPALRLRVLPVLP